MKNPKIFFQSMNSASGVETTGNTIFSMLEDYMKEYPSNVYKYTLQNPPHLISLEMAKFKPDIIILNEFYPRFIRANVMYKIYHPETKIIFINHCWQNLTKQNFRMNESDRDIIDFDSEVMIREFIYNYTDQIFTLNYHPREFEYPQKIKDKTLDLFFPINDIFKITIPWINRKKDFFYYGALVPLKISEEFIDKIGKTNLHLDVYGRFVERLEKTDEKYRKYKEKLLSCKNIAYLGYIPDEKLIDTINQYRFFVTPHDGQEPFMLCLAEAIRCGCVPLIIHKRRTPNSEWLDWARNCIIEYPTVDKLLEKMEYYDKQYRHDSITLNTLNTTSKEISETMQRRTYYRTFKETFLKYIFED